jgi:hypothetical protein
MCNSLKAARMNLRCSFQPKILAKETSKTSGPLGPAREKRKEEKRREEKREERREKRKERREKGEEKRGEKRTLLLMRGMLRNVGRQCSHVILIRIYWGEGRPLGSEGSKTLGSGRWKSDFCSPFLRLSTNNGKSSSNLPPYPWYQKMYDELEGIEEGIGSDLNWVLSSNLPGGKSKKAVPVLK